MISVQFMCINFFHTEKARAELSLQVLLTDGELIPLLLCRGVSLPVSDHAGFCRLPNVVPGDIVRSVWESRLHFHVADQSTLQRYLIIIIFYPPVECLVVPPFDVVLF